MNKIIISPPYCTREEYQALKDYLTEKTVGLAGNIFRKSRKYWYTGRNRTNTVAGGAL